MKKNDQIMISQLNNQITIEIQHCFLILRNVYFSKNMARIVRDNNSITSFVLGDGHLP